MPLNVHDDDMPPTWMEVEPSTSLADLLNSPGPLATRGREPWTPAPGAPRWSGVVGPDGSITITVRPAPPLEGSPMNLYLLRWHTPEISRRTAFNGVVVVAPDHDTARAINPRGDHYSHDAEGWHLARRWADSPDEVEAVLLGTAVEGDRARVVLASFREVQGSY